MKKYVKPIIDVIEFESEHSIICTSNTTQSLVVDEYGDVDDSGR